MSDEAQTERDSDSHYGSAPDMSSRVARHEVLSQAFCYRGDVTIQSSDGMTIIGYIFDRGSDGDGGFVRVMPANGGERVKIRDDQIEALIFSGRDTAEGKSWETWLKSYREKKVRGESANIYSESIE